MSTQQIWANRLRRELDGLSKHCADITGATVTLLDHQMDVQTGLCKSYFALHIPLPNAGSDAAVQFSLEVDCDVRTRYIHFTFVFVLNQVLLIIVQCTG
jgi:hypothetical protein